MLYVLFWTADHCNKVIVILKNHFSVHMTFFILEQVPDTV